MKSLPSRLKDALLCIAFAFVCTFSALSPAHAQEISLDSLNPGNTSDCNSPIRDKYGNVVVAGSTTTITKIEFVIQSFISAAPANSIRVNVSTGAPMSTTGSLVGTFSQSSLVGYPSDGSDRYLITFTGSANVTQGSTYYIQTSYVGSNVDQNICLTSNAYSTQSGWDFAKSGSNYVNLYNTGTFNWFAYHKMRITTGAVVTSPTFSSLQLPGNTSIATFRTTATLTANVAAPSRVTFFANDKRIAKCIRVLTSGTAPNITATCNWKPSQRGSARISARAFPVDSSLSIANSSQLNISVQHRTTKR